MHRLLLTAMFLQALCASMAGAQTPVPSALLGKWRVMRVLKTGGVSCWDETHIRSFVGSTLDYRPRTLIWKGGKEPLIGLIAVERTLDEAQFFRDYRVTFKQLQLPPNAHMREITLQHEDADVTGGATEIPGDTALLAAPGRIIVQACNVFFEARRTRR